MAWFVDSDDVVDMRPVAGMVEWLKQNEDGLQFKVYSLQPDENQNQNEYRKVDLVMFDLDTFEDNETLTLRKATGRRTKFGNDTALRNTALRNTALRNADATKTIDGNDNENENEKVAERFVAKRIVAQRFVAKRFVDKKDFLSQHISFFHQQFWYRNENQNQNEEKRIHFTEGIRVAEDLERMYKYFTLCQQPVKFEATLYHYRVRETSVTQNENYRKKAVEDLPVVLNHLAEWIRRNDIKAEPWLDLRIMKLFQNLLYSASQMPNLNTKLLKNTIRNVMATYCRLGFSFTKKAKYKLAVYSINSFFLLNKLYLKIVEYQS